MRNSILSFGRTVVVGLLLLMTPMTVLSTPVPSASADNFSFTLQYANEGLTCAAQDVTVVALRNGAIWHDFKGTIQLNAIQTGNTALTWFDASGDKLKENRYTFTPSDRGQAHFKLSNMKAGLVQLQDIQLLNPESARFEQIASTNGLSGLQGGNEEEEVGGAGLLPIYFRTSGFQITYHKEHMAGQVFDLTIEAVTSEEGVCQRNRNYMGEHEVALRKTTHHQFDAVYSAEIMKTKVVFPELKANDNFLPLSDNTITKTYRLNFGDTTNGGQAVLKVRYDGIGIFSFNVSDLRENLFGESSPVAITPAKLKINQVVLSDKEASNFSALQNGTPGELPSVFAVAGESFQVEVVALNTQNEVILGFGHEVPREDLALTFERVLPREGLDGVLSVCWQHLPLNTPNCQGVIVPERKEGLPGVWATVNYDEVGQIRLIAAMQDGHFWQNGIPQENISVAGEASHTMLVGRFIPAKIVVIDSKIAPKFTAACAINDVEGFTYLGQPIVQSNAAIPTMIIKAENLAGGVIKNYRGDFWRLESNFHPELINLATVENTALMNATVTLAEQKNEKTLYDLLKSESLISAEDQGQGYAAFQFFTPVNLQYAKPEANQTIAPFEAKIALNYYLKEQDGVLVYRANQSDPVATITLPADKSDERWAKLTFGTPEAGIEFLHGKTIYQGRLYLSNASRATMLPMQMPLMVQYYDGKQFVRNTKDNCTVFKAAPQIIEASFESNEQRLAALAQKYASNVSTDGDAVDGRFIAGQRLIQVDNAAYINGQEAPPPYGYMIIQLPIDEANQSWLTFPWEADRNYPKARASIGIWEGDAPIIFKSEQVTLPH